MNNGLKVLKYFQCARLQKSREFSSLATFFASASSLDAIVHVYVLKED